MAKNRAILISIALLLVFFATFWSEGYSSQSDVIKNISKNMFIFYKSSQRDPAACKMKIAGLGDISYRMVSDDQKRDFLKNELPWECGTYYEIKTKWLYLVALICAVGAILIPGGKNRAER